MLQTKKYCLKTERESKHKEKLLCGIVRAGKAGEGDAVTVADDIHGTLNEVHALHRGGQMHEPVLGEVIGQRDFHIDIRIQREFQQVSSLDVNDVAGERNA